MFRMKDLPAAFPTEQAFQALEIMKQHNIRCDMPSDDMFFTSAFHLPHPDLRWRIRVRRRDFKRAMEVLAAEGLINGATPASRAEAEAAGVTPAAPEAASRRIRPDRARSGCRCPVSAAPAARPANIP